MYAWQVGCFCFFQGATISRDPVETDAPQAVSARRLALEFLLSRVPGSDLLREMAAREGVTETRFASPPPAGEIELCVLCGLCVRVCREAIGASALCFIGRGSERRVGTPFDLQSEACIGCGACAEICPTGAIRIEDRGNQRLLHTWNTVFCLLIFHPQLCSRSCFPG